MQLVQIYKICVYVRERFVQGIHLQMEVEVVSTAPLILVRCFSGLRIDIDQLENEATPSFIPVATSESSFFLSFFWV